MIKAWIVCIAVAAALWTSPSSAQTPSAESLAVAREVVVLTGGEDAMRTMMDTMRPMMLEDLRGRGLPQDVAERYVTLFIEEFDRETPRIIELSAVAYAGAFSLEELREIRAFFRTDTGRAVAERTPELMSAMTRAGALIAEEIAPRVVARMQSEAPPGGPS
jgi:uncharacterized protein